MRAGLSDGRGCVRCVVFGIVSAVAAHAEDPLCSRAKMPMASRQCALVSCRTVAFDSGLNLLCHTR
jgi:hypothetical protein